MEESFKCPLCSKNNWNKSFIYSFEKADFSNSFNSKSYDKRYWAKRQHILQNLWLAGKKEVKLTSLYCNNCGFMCYSPRPNEDDLTNKYVFLNSFEQSKVLDDPKARSSRINEKRALRIFRIVKNYLGSTKPDVLDYGGYNGRLLKYFVRTGCNSYLVDYTEETIEGVEKIGSTIADIPEGFRFDAIICSHVLEHVVDPVGLLNSFRPFLKDNGLIYVEIPLEVWKGTPITYDPVTHINFFTTDSLKTAILSSNYRIINLKADLQPYNENYKRVAWAMIGHKKHEQRELIFTSSKTRRLLNPGIISKGRRLAEDLWLKLVLNPHSAVKILRKISRK